MPKFTIIQSYKMQDIWKNVEAKNGLWITMPVMRQAEQ